MLTKGYFSKCPMGIGAHATTPLTPHGAYNNRAVNQQQKS